jgi:uncharacterized membrane protein
MLRRALMERQGEVDSEGFRLRGTEVTRLEGLADGVFALAVTLLILSSEVPQTFAELREAIKNLPAFAICFALLMWYWGEHFIICRRYGQTSDKTGIFLTSLLLFVVLFYVYPLKFLFTIVVGAMFFGKTPTLTEAEAQQLFLLYGIGFAGVALVFLLMHVHALRSRTQLELSPVEVVLVRGEVVKCIALMGIAAGSITLAYTLPIRMIGFAGPFYAITGASEGFFSWCFGKKARRLQAQAAPSD